jgi:hypothetical protein
MNMKETPHLGMARINLVVSLVLLLVCKSVIAAEDVWQIREVSPVWQNE